MSHFDRFQKPNYRRVRVEQLILEVVSELFSHQKIKDAVLSEVDITIMSVNCTDDFRYAKIFYSCLSLNKPTKPEIQKIQKAFHRAAPYIQSVLRKNLTLFKSPEITFEFDDKLHQSERVWQLIDELRQKNASQQEQTP